ncbi:MAG: PP2C family protein-serine/threonine phosphatase [Eubacteriales bacterium]
MDTRRSVFVKNEQLANIYVAKCLLITTGIVLLIWFLNIIRVFLTDLTLVNIVMPIGIIFLVVPALLVLQLKKNGSWVKYLCLSCFVMGMGVLYIGLTFQAILAWIPPIALSRHYYSKKATNFTLVITLIIMLIATYLGAIFGVPDGNMFGVVCTFSSLNERIEFLSSTLINGHSIYYRVFVNFYIPRAFIIFVAYLVAFALSERTYKILMEQENDLSEKKRIRDELAMATNIQDSMLPNVFPAFPHRNEFDIYAKMTPSKEVGGDFYDFFLVDEDHLAIVMADVSGKGVPAALFMMSAKMMIKNLAKPNKSPAKILTETNKQLCGTHEGDMFVSVWLGIYEISSGKLAACNAGHEYPILKQGDAPYSIFKNTHDLVLGGMDDIIYKDYELQFNPGDVLFLYTDGIPEAINKEKRAYGIERLLEVLNSNRGNSLKMILESVNADVKIFEGDTPQFDDITMLAVEIQTV